MCTIWISYVMKTILDSTLICARSALFEHVNMPGIFSVESADVRWSLAFQGAQLWTTLTALLLPYVQEVRFWRCRMASALLPFYASGLILRLWAFRVCVSAYGDKGMRTGRSSPLQFSLCKGTKSPPWVFLGFSEHLMTLDIPSLRSETVKTSVVLFIARKILILSLAPVGLNHYNAP